MVTSIVSGWMPIPSIIEVSGLVFLVVMEREIPVFEPDHLQTSGADSVWVEPLVIHAHQTFGSERWLLIYSNKTVVGCESLLDDIKVVKINRCTGKRTGLVV